MMKIRPRFKRFLSDNRGSVATLFAFAAIPLAIGLGVAIDYGRALLMRERMQVALDAATLGVGSWPGLSTAQMQTKAQAFFDANLPAAAKLGSISPVTLSTSGNKIIISVSGSVPTTFMRLVNIDHVDIGATTTVAVGTGTTEVALALDNSGSMAGSKLNSLKTSASSLVDTLFAAAQNSQETDPIKIAVVPFAASVNVGSQYANASWMDTTGIGKYHAYEQKCYANGGTLNSSGACSVSVGTGINNFTLFNSLKDSSGNAIAWGGCVEARPEPYDVQDDAPSTGNPSTMFVPMFAPDESDNWTATTSTCTVANGCTFACADGGSSCSSTSSTLVFNGAPPGSRNYNNYLPDAGANAGTNTCGDSFTVTIASPGVFTKTNHGFVAGDQVIFSTTGALPTGLNNRTRYFVLSTGLTANTFRVSTTNGGTAVNTSGSQSGTHFIANAFTCRGANTPPEHHLQQRSMCADRHHRKCRCHEHTGRPGRTEGFWRKEPGQQRGQQPEQFELQIRYADQQGDGREHHRERPSRRAELHVHDAAPAAAFDRQDDDQERDQLHGGARRDQHRGRRDVGLARALSRTALYGRASLRHREQSEVLDPGDRRPEHLLSSKPRRFPQVVVRYLRLCGTGPARHDLDQLIGLGPTPWFKEPCRLAPTSRPPASPSIRWLSRFPATM